MHMQARDLEAVPSSQREHFGELFVPDSVLCVVTAGVRLLAVSVTEIRVDARCNVAARCAPTELVDHVGGATVYMNPSIDSQREGFLVEDIRRVDDGRWIAVWLVPHRERWISPAPTASMSTPLRRTRSRHRLGRSGPSIRVDTKNLQCVGAIPSDST